MTSPESLKQLPTAGLVRRLLAAVYDLLLVMAICVVAGFVALPVIIIFEVKTGNPYFRAYLFFIIFAFFAWFWIRGGATLGMRAWRLRLIQPDGSDISLPQAMLRFVTAFLTLLCLTICTLWLVDKDGFALPGVVVIFSGCYFALGFFWGLFDKDRYTWHDRLSGTRVVVLPKVKKIDE